MTSKYVIIYCYPVNLDFINVFLVKIKHLTYNIYIISITKKVIAKFKKVLS